MQKPEMGQANRLPGARLCFDVGVDGNGWISMDV